MGSEVEGPWLQLRDPDPRSHSPLQGAGPGESVPQNLAVCPGDPGRGSPLCLRVSISPEGYWLPLFLTSPRVCREGQPVARKRGSLGSRGGGIPEPRGQAWHQRAAGRGPDSPDHVEQNHELDQPEDDAHLLVAHEHHAGGVVLEEEGGQLILQPPRHAGPGGARAEPTQPSPSGCVTTRSPDPGQLRAGRWVQRSGVRGQLQAPWVGREDLGCPEQLWVPGRQWTEGQPSLWTNKFPKMDGGGAGRVTSPEAPAAPPPPPAPCWASGNRSCWQETTHPSRGQISCQPPARWAAWLQAGAPPQPHPPCQGPTPQPNIPHLQPGGDSQDRREEGGRLWSSPDTSGAHSGTPNPRPRLPIYRPSSTPASQPGLAQAPSA